MLKDLSKFTCPKLDKTAMREDMAGRNRSWYGSTMTWIGFMARRI